MRSCRGRRLWTEGRAFSFAIRLTRPRLAHDCPRRLSVVTPIARGFSVSFSWSSTVNPSLRSDGASLVSCLPITEPLAGQPLGLCSSRLCSLRRPSSSVAVPSKVAYSSSHSAQLQANGGGLKHILCGRSLGITVNGHEGARRPVGALAGDSPFAEGGHPGQTARAGLRRYLLSPSDRPSSKAPKMMGAASSKVDISSDSVRRSASAMGASLMVIDRSARSPRTEGFSMPVRITGLEASMTTSSSLV